MASSLCGFCSFCGLSGSCLLPSLFLLAIIADSRPFRCDEAFFFRSFLKIFLGILFFFFWSGLFFASLFRLGLLSILMVACLRCEQTHAATIPFLSGLFWRVCGLICQKTLQCNVSTVMLGAILDGFVGFIGLKNVDFFDLFSCGCFEVEEVHAFG